MTSPKKPAGKKRTSPQPKNDSSNANQPVQNCPLKAESKELAVMDKESSGYRHYDKSTSLLEIVQTAKSDEVTFHYTGPDPKPAIKLRIDGVVKDPIKGESAAGGKLYKLPVSYMPKSAPYGKNFALNKLDKLFTKKHRPTVYSVEGITGNVAIKAYNPDQWKLTIKLPPLKGMKLGARMENSKTTQEIAGGLGKKTTEKQELIVEKTNTSWRKVSSSSLSTSYESYCEKLSGPNPYQVNGAEFNIKSEVKPVKTTPFIAGITLSHNGQGLDSQLDVLNGIINFVTTFTDVIKAFKDMTPKVGWYIDFDLKVFEGSFELAWGWREQADHLAYYYVGAAANLTIIEVMFEFGFGLSCGGVKAQICVQFKGGLGLKLGIETRPTAPSSATLGEFKGNISAGGYVRCGVGDLVKVEAGIVTGITITLTVDSVIGVSASSHIELNTATKWDGLSIEASFSTILGFQRKKKFDLIKAKEIGKKNLLGGRASTPTELKTVLEVKDIALSSLVEGYNLRVFSSRIVISTSVFTQKESRSLKWERVSNDLVAELIALKVWENRSTLLLTNQNIEGLMHGIRTDCDKIASKQFKRDWMKSTELYEYLVSAAFKKRIKDANDVVKTFQADIKKKAPLP